MNTPPDEARLGGDSAGDAEPPDTVAYPDPQPLTEQWLSRYSMECMHCDGMGIFRK